MYRLKRKKDAAGSKLSAPRGPGRSSSTIPVLPRGREMSTRNCVHRINHPHIIATEVVVQWYCLHSLWSEVAGSIPALCLFLCLCFFKRREIKKGIINKKCAPSRSRTAVCTVQPLSQSRVFICYRSKIWFCALQGNSLNNLNYKSFFLSSSQAFYRAHLERRMTTVGIEPRVRSGIHR